MTSRELRCRHAINCRRRCIFLVSDNEEHAELTKIEFRGFGLFGMNSYCVLIEKTELIKELEKLKSTK